MILIFEIDGEEKRIDVPLAMNQIRFDDFCDFKAAENEYFKLNEDEDVESAAPINKLLEAIRSVVKGDVDALPFSYKEDKFNDLVDNGYQVKIGDEISIIRLYAHFVVMVKRYKPDRIPQIFFWSWKGTKYMMKSAPAARVLAKRALTTGEAIEILEHQRRASNAIDANPNGEGNIDFTLGLTEVSLLLRKPKEKLPSNTKALEVFIKKRSNVFKNMMLDKVMDMRFFLLNALVKLAATQTTNSSSTDLRGRIGSKKRAITKKNGRNWLRRRGRSTGGESITK